MVSVPVDARQSVPCVDVAISYYGKPFQTLLTIRTLLRYSGQHISRVYLIEEAQQPDAGGCIDYVTSALPGMVTVLQPKHYLGWARADLGRSRVSDDYRRSIRYQYALEESDQSYMLLAHNDVRFTGDLVGEFLRVINDGLYAGAGAIGQCWNCPAKTAGVCGDGRFSGLNLTYVDAVLMCTRQRSSRTRPWLINPLRPVPLPECRLNEFACLLDMDAYRRETMPWGELLPFGVYNRGVDLGCGWFRSMIRRGHEFANVNIWDYCVHSAGHPALFDAETYADGEARARSILARESALEIPDITANGES